MKTARRSRFTARGPVQTLSLSVLSTLLLISAPGCLGNLDVVESDVPEEDEPSTNPKQEPNPNEPGPKSESIEGDFFTPDPALPGDDDDEDDSSEASEAEEDSPEPSMDEDGMDSEDWGGGAGSEPDDEDSESNDSPDDSKKKDSAGDDPGKILNEADVVHMDGDRAYVLSEASGLHILDLQDPAKIKILGHKALDGAPFEMYVKGSSVLVMVRDQFFFDESEKAWKSASSIVRLNASRPDKIQKVDEVRLLGRVSDSRMEGERLYVVAYEDGRCFDCDDQKRVRVSSLLAKDGTAVSKVDEVVFEQNRRFPRTPTAYFGQKQVFVAMPTNSTAGEGTTRLLHRAAVNWESGDLKGLEAIRVEGRILSRWQMNQEDDVLRVFSQPTRWDLEPKLETFKLDGEKATMLGAIDVKLPEPEDLKSARFDGDRAYLITFRRTDPLFTFDLKDPKAPKQLGELEIPGWVYHMEPRGDRLLGVGYNGEFAKERLSLTLFDVSELAEPKVLSRVDFGGDEADFAEGQDQIHKSVKFIDDKNLILVPYGSRYAKNDDDSDMDEPSSMESWDPGMVAKKEYGRIDCGDQGSSAIQLFDWNKDELKRRGKAPVMGGARRSFLHRNRLIALSDSEVAAYNIDDRDKPTQLSRKTIASRAHQLLVMGEHTVRISGGGRGEGRQLEVVKNAQVAGVEVVSSLSLGALDENACSDGRDVRVEELFAHGDNLYISYRTWDSSYRQMNIAVVSLKDVKKPKVLGSLEVESGYASPTYKMGPVRVLSRVFGAVGDRVVVAGVRRDWDEATEQRELTTVFSLLRVDPVKGLIKEAELRRDHTRYAGGLIPAGNELGSWHARKTDKPGKLKFYYDRFYVDAQGKFRHQAVNVPGAPVGRDSVHRRLLTMNFHLNKVDLDPVACQEHVKFHAWDWEKSDCTLLETALTEVELPEGAPAKQLKESSLSGEQHRQELVFFHEDRVFSTALNPKEEEGGLRVIAGLDPAGVLRQSRFDSAEEIGHMVMLNGAQVLESSDHRDLRVLDGRKLDAMVQRSYATPHRWCESPVIFGEQLVCALGRFGVRKLAPKK